MCHSLKQQKSTNNWWHYYEIKFNCLALNIIIQETVFDIVKLKLYLMKVLGTSAFTVNARKTKNMEAYFLPAIFTAALPFTDNLYMYAVYLISFTFMM